MNKLKKIIILVIFLIIILVALLLYYSSKIQQSDTEEINKIVEGQGDVGEGISSEIMQVSDTEEYYTIKTLVNSYYNLLISEDKVTLYNIINPNCVQFYKINEDNILNALEKDNYNYIDDIERLNVKINKMLVSSSENIQTYFIYGKVQNKVTKEEKDFSLVIETQMGTLTYYIMPYNYLKELGYNSINIGENYETKYTEIPNNNYNTFDYNYVEDYTVLLDHISDYKDKLVYNLEDSYNLYSNEYKESKFNNIGLYEQYINNNIKTILRSSIKKYKITEEDDYTIYTCIDQYGNYYIFKEKGVMDYTVMLDNYTIETEDFTKKYNNSDNKAKAELNLEKICEALNRKDYNYLYSKLDNSYRQVNFPTNEDFKNYIMQNSSEINSFEYGDYDIQENKIIYSIIIKDATEENETTIEKNFTVNLGEGTNFTFSFNM